MPDESAVRVSDLYTNDSAKREAAIARLVAVGEPAVAPLVRLLKNFESEYACIYQSREVNASINQGMVEAIQRALQGIGAPAVPSLITLMRDTDAKVQERAATALNRIGQPAVAPLIHLLQHGDNKVRVSAATALAGIEDERAVLALREALHAESVEVRAAAAGALAGTEDEQTFIALRRTLMDAAAESRRLRRRRLVTGLGIYAAILGVLVPISVLLHWKSDFLVQMFIQMSIQASVGLIAFDATVSVRKNAVTALGKTASPRMAGAFAICLRDRNDDIRKAAARVLKELLPKVQASDRQYFAPAEMDALLRAFGRKDEALDLAILQALQQIGDDRAVSKVEELCQKGGSAAVRRAATDCLPFLQARAEETRQARTLLRASHAEAAVATDMLLRPLMAQTETPAEELLRPIIYSG